MCKTLIIDNFDSFTYTLYQYMGEICGIEPRVVLNTIEYDSIALKNYDCVIVSPGPGSPSCPSDIGISAKIIREASIPLLGVCLGHQAIGYINGMEIVHAPEPVHGRMSRIKNTGIGLFKNLPPEIFVVRYHSLIIKTLKGPFQQTAWGEDGMIQAIQHKYLPIHGVQFHPESVCSQSGMEMLRNFRNIAIASKKKNQRVA
jgi:para-aminobenzoate synthetase